MTRYVLAVGATLSAVLSLAVPQLATAAGTNPSPADEVLNGDSTVGGGPFSSTITCATSANGTLQYTISGLALGPYPGTFTESGTLTITAGVVTAFSASFTVTSGTTSLTGTKTGPSGTGGAGQCIENTPDFPAGTDFFVASGFGATYDMTIQGPAGTNRFTGSVQDSFNFTSGTFPSGGSQEVFETATEAPVCPDDR
jgi:hypothetical protein